MDREQLRKELEGEKAKENKELVKRLEERDREWYELKREIHILKGQKKALQNRCKILTHKTLCHWCDMKNDCTL